MGVANCMIRDVVGCCIIVINDICIVGIVSAVIAIADNGIEISGLL